ncbi:DUF4224 domain-containing protein [Xylophilus ampelinus]|nr:DUF4224 domain-containing protein [Xylophilus ampelinus]MCS4508926.1 DUF4224 domain-containing protein [Xylophilus ampelinus]
MFLNAEEVAELTGISRGKHGRTCGEVQAAQLSAMKIPYYRNATGRPVVARAVVEGAALAQAATTNDEWMPDVMRGLRQAHG